MKRSILMADDDLGPRNDFYGARLEEEGHLLLYYKKGQPIIEDVREGLRYDVAIIDLSLPDIDGVEVIRQLKEMYPSTPIISASGYLFLNSAADYKLVKPFGYNDLVQAINRFVPGTIEDKLGLLSK